MGMLIKYWNSGKLSTTKALKNRGRMERLRFLTIPSLWNIDINCSDGDVAKPNGTTRVWRINGASHLLREKVSRLPLLRTQSMPGIERENFSCRLMMVTLGLMSPKTSPFRLDTSKRYVSQGKPSMSQQIWELCIHATAQLAEVGTEQFPGWLYD